MKPAEAMVEEVRAFGRFFIGRLGPLAEAHPAGSHTLTELRILDELAHRHELAAADLGRTLRLDAGYLSRILRGFEADGLVTRWPSEADGRVNLVGLTPKGRAALGPLEQAARTRIARMLEPLPPEAREQVVEAMRRIRTAFEDAAGGA